MYSCRTALAMFCVTAQMLSAAEVSYQETTRITGGALVGMMKFASAFNKSAPKVGDPIITTVAVQGNRMARWTQDSAEIIDLDAKTITHVDKAKHTYTVTTFEQVKQAVEQGIEKARQEQAKAADQPKQQPSDPNVQLGFEAHVRDTGAAKQVAGLNTNEKILTLMMNAKDKTNGQQGALGITNDMWMASDVPAYDVVRDFEKRYAIEMGTEFTSTPEFTSMLKQAQSNDALKQMGKEMSQLKGVPVLQVMRMGMSQNGQPLPAASEAALPSNANGPGVGEALTGQLEQAGVQTAQQTAAQETSQKVRGALGSNLGSAIGGMGGFGGFGRKKKQQQQQPAAADTASPSSTSTAAASPQSAVLMESTTELGNFSEHVDPALLQVPTGFQLLPGQIAK